MMEREPVSPIATIAEAARQIDVDELLLSFDTAFDIPLRHWQAVGLLQLTRSVGASRDRIGTLTTVVGEAWCEIVRADVELELRRGLATVEASRDDATTLLGAATGDGPAAYVAARWHDGAGKLLYRIGSHARARMDLDTACTCARDQDLWWCLPDMRSNLLRASAEEARQASATADVGAGLEAAIADCVEQARIRGIDLTAGVPESVPARELLRGYSSLLHNLAWSLQRSDPARSLAESRRASAISTRLGDAYRLAQATNHQALLIQSQHRALGVDRAEAAALYRTVRTLPWVRGTRIAEQQLAVLRGGRAGARDLATLLDVIVAEAGASGGPAGLDTDLRQFTVRAYVELTEELADADASRTHRRLRDDARERELQLARSLHQVIALPAYKRAYNGTVRPVFLRRIARDLYDGASGRVRKEHWEEILTMVEESSGRELLDMMSSTALPQLGPPPPAEGAKAEPPPDGPVAPNAVRGGLRRALTAEQLEDDRQALMAREQEFEEQFLSRPLEAAPVDREIARTAERYVVNHPGTCIVRYFTHGFDKALGPTGLSAFVIRDGITRPVECGDLAAVRRLAVELAERGVPSEQHVQRIWELLVAPVWEEVQRGAGPVEHLVLIPTDELFGIPLHVASVDGCDSEPLGALVPMSQSVSLTAFLTRGRHLLRRQRVERNDDLAALVVRDSGISADELVRASWPARHVIVAGTAPAALTGRFRRHDADWSGLQALADVGPEFFLYAGHGHYHPSYGDLGPYLEMRDSAGRRDHLTPYDVALRVRLPRNRLTILAACLAGQGAQTSGGDVGGFLRAFIAAGAGAIAVPLWPVLDRAIARTAGTLLARSRADAAAGEPYDVVQTLHGHYREMVDEHPGWIDHLPLALYT